MTVGEVRVYVNERGVSVPEGSSALDAVRVLFPDEAERLVAGKARLADSRGLPTDATQRLVNGAIFRTMPVRERSTETE